MNSMIRIALCCLAFVCGSAKGSCEQEDRATCSMLPAICQDPQLSSTYCPHMCGLCPQTTTHVPLQDACMDNIGNGMQCSDLPGVCSDLLAGLFCRRTCHFCTPATTSLSSTISSGPSVPWTDRCDDHLVNGYSCNQQLCNLQYGQTVCRKTCGHCTDVINSTTTLATTFTAAMVDTSTAALKTTPTMTPTTTATTAIDSTTATEDTTTAAFNTAATTIKSTNNNAATSTATITTASTTTANNDATITTTTATTKGAFAASSKTGQDYAAHSMASSSPAKPFGTAITTPTTTAATTKVFTNTDIASTANTLPTSADRSTVVTPMAEVETCVDNIGHGLTCRQLSGVCFDSLARNFCRRTCHLCHPNPLAVTLTTTSSAGPAIGACVDYLTNGLTCSMVPDVCKSVFGSVVCQRFCMKCDPMTTTARPTTTQPPTTTERTTMLTTPMAEVETCVDNIGHGLTCRQLSGVCSDPFGRIFCRRTCHICHPNPLTVTLTTTSSAGPAIGACVDYLTNGLTCSMVPGVCKSVFGSVICQMFCKTCDPMTTTARPATTQPPTTIERTTMLTTSEVETCVDNIGHGLTCRQLSGVCSDPFGRIFCRRTCHICHPNPLAVTPTTASSAGPAIGACVDHVINGLTCSMVPGVCQSILGMVTCPQFCNKCDPATTTARATTTQPSTTTERTTMSTKRPPVETCVDNIGNGLTCQQLPSVCLDPYGHVVCRRTCKLCQPNPHVVTPQPHTSATSSSCVDHVVNGLSCAVLPSVCKDPYGQIICMRHCGKCQPEAESTTSVGPPPTTTGYTTTTTTMTAEPTTPLLDTCVDMIGEGMTCSMINGICSNLYGHLVCQRTCGLCKPNPLAVTLPPPSSVTTSGCVDHVVNRVHNSLSCSRLPGVCNDAYGQFLCPKYCRQCVDTPTTPTTTPTTTTITPTTASPGTQPATSAVSAGHTSVFVPQTSPPGVPVTSSTRSHDYGTCIDHIGLGMDCSVYRGVCGDIYSTLLCPKFCGFCVPSSLDPPVMEPTSKTHVTDCADRVTNGLSCADILPGVCADKFGRQFCAKTCQACPTTVKETTATTASVTSDSTSPPESTAATSSQLTKSSALSPTDTTVSKSTNPSQSHPTLLTKFTAAATGHTTVLSSKTTMDAATVAMTTPTLSSRKPSSTGSVSMTTVTSTPPAGLCSDNVGLGLSCDAIPNVCADPMAPIICKKTCGYCECKDKIVGMTCQELLVVHDINPCLDALGGEVCSKFCGFC